MPYKFNPFTSNLDQVEDTSGFGDVSGPGSSTDDALVRWDGLTGTLIKDSTVLLDDLGNITGAESITLNTPLAETSGGTGNNTYATGDILYASAADTLSKLAAGSDGDVLTLASGVPDWVTPTADCAFLAYVSADIPDVTGAGANYTVVFNSEFFDIGSNFNTTTGVFTAPVTGQYQFNCNVRLEQLDATSTNGNIQLNTTARLYLFCEQNLGVVRNPSNNLNLHFSILVDMTAGDTASVRVNVSNMAGNTVDVGGAATTPITTFSGFLVK